MEVRYKAGIGSNSQFYDGLLMLSVVKVLGLSLILSRDEPVLLVLVLKCEKLQQIRIVCSYALKPKFQGQTFPNRLNLCLHFLWVLVVERSEDCQYGQLGLASSIS